MPQCSSAACAASSSWPPISTEAGRFYENVWGLRPVKSRDGTRLFRGTGAYHHILGLHRGAAAGAHPHRVRRGGPARRRRAASRRRGLGLPPRRAGAASAAGGGYGFGCKDPDGRNLAFVCGCADHADAQDAARPAAQDRARQSQCPRLRCQPALLHRRRSACAQIDENAPLWFLHCEGPDHSSIVLAKTNQPTLNHVAFEMPDFDFGHARHRTDEGQRLSDRMGSGTARPGRQRVRLFLRAGRGADRVHRPRCCRSTTATCRAASDYWKFPPGRSDHWGITQPRSAALLPRAAAVRLHRGRLPPRLNKRSLALPPPDQSGQVRGTEGIAVGAAFETSAPAAGMLGCSAQR